MYGSPYENCQQAIRFLNESFSVKKISEFYKSEPIPKSDQPWFVNGVINISSKLSPTETLNVLMNIT